MTEEKSVLTEEEKELNHNVLEFSIWVSLNEDKLKGLYFNGKVDSLVRILDSIVYTSSLFKEKNKGDTDEHNS